MATEDAAALPAGRCEAEGFGVRFANEGVERAVTAQLACGQGTSRQWSLSVSGVRTEEGARHAVLGLGGKQAWTLGDALPVALSVNLNTLHETHRRVAWSNLAVTAVASPSLGDATTLHLNLGWLRASGDGNATWNLALEHALSPRWSVSAEVYGVGQEPAWRAAGLRWAATPAFDLNVSAGLQAGTGAGLVTAGLRYGF